MYLYKYKGPKLEPDRAKLLILVAENIKESEAARYIYDDVDLVYPDYKIHYLNVSGPINGEYHYDYGSWSDFYMLTPFHYTEKYYGKEKVYNIRGHS